MRQLTIWKLTINIYEVVKVFKSKLLCFSALFTLFIDILEQNSFFSTVYMYLFQSYCKTYLAQEDCITHLGLSPDKYCFSTGPANFIF
jgi:hypothetical protein